MSSVGYWLLTITMKKDMAAAAISLGQVPPLFACTFCACLGIPFVSK